MENPTLKGFVSFLEKEPEKIIDHDTWATCAVGEYLSSLGIECRDEIDLIHKLVDEEHQAAVEKFMEELNSVYDAQRVSLLEALGHGDLYAHSDVLKFIKEATSENN